MMATDNLRTKRLKNIIIILFFNTIPLFAFSNDKKEQPTFHGTIKKDGKPVGFDSITIQYMKPFSPIGTVSSKEYVVTDANGNFSFKLPKFGQPIKMIVNIRIKNKKLRLNDGYLVEASDNIRIDITKTESSAFAEFYGHGAEKYNITNGLYDLVREFIEKRTGLKLFRPDSLSKKLVSFNGLTEKYEKIKQNIINHSKLDDKMKKMISYEFGNFHSLWSTAYRKYFYYTYRNNQELQSLIKNSFNENKDRFSYENDSLMIHCRNYFLDIANREAIDLLINSPSSTISSVSFYDSIKTKYSGLLRERLMANFFIGNVGVIEGFQMNNLVHDSLMLEAEKYMTISFVKKIYSDKLRLSAGKELFNSSFIALNGNKVSTESLVGKVVLIDMWALGCSWCAVFHKMFHQDVYPLLKDNKDFIYLSINSDEDPKRWEMGLKQGIYTSFEYLNVSTGKLGTAHPFLKHYNIQSLPFLLLIDKKGKIHSNNFGEMRDIAMVVQKLLNQ